MGRERPVKEHRRPSWIMWTAFAMRFKACQQGADRTVSEQEHKRAGADNNKGKAVRTVSRDRRDREVNADRRKVDNRAAAHNRAGSRLAASRVAHRAAVRLANEVIVVATGR